MRKCMNKVVACFMVMAMAAGLTGCGGNKTSKEEENVTSVVQENNRTEAASEEAGADVEYADDACEEIWDFQNNKSDASVEMDIARGETEFNTNEYNNVAENGWMQVENAPLSTFAADVDTASYSQIRSCIQNGYDVDPSMVRIEEMINYFHYDYEKPKKGEKFAVYTEYMDCPWNTDTKLAMVAMNTEDIDFSEAPASNLVFLIDTSGSMFDDNKLPLVQQSMCLLAENLTKKDRVSVVTYAGSDEVRLQGAKGNEYHKIAQTIEELEAWGSTNGSVGIETAYEIARENFIEGGNNRVILCTDGDLNVGVTSEGELERLITKEKESGVFLSVLGVGYGNYKDNKLETLADKGNGNYAYIDSIFEAKKALVDEMGANMTVVAKDVKLQVEFNPEQVKGYRLIGYENRVMDAQDFADDTKDGGEMGAGHSVTALYEIIPVDSDMEIPEIQFKYDGNKKQEEVENKTSFADELFTVNIRYKEPDGDKSKLESYPCSNTCYNKEGSDNLRWAAAVAAFGMILKESAYCGKADIDMVLKLARSARNDNMDIEYQDEFIELVGSMYQVNLLGID